MSSIPSGSADCVTRMKISAPSHELGGGLACELQHDKACLGLAALMQDIKIHVLLMRRFQAQVRSLKVSKYWSLGA